MVGSRELARANTGCREAAERPETLLALAWVAHFQGRFDLLRLFVAAIDAANASDTPAPQELADVHLFKGVLAYWAGDASESLYHLETVRRLSPGREQLRECVAQVYLTLARHRSGDAAAAREALDQLLAADPPKAQFLARLLAAKAFTHALSADARPVGRLGRQIEDLGARERRNFMRAWGVYLQAISALQLHHLPEARDSFIRAFDARRLVEKRAAADIIAGLALTTSVTRRDRSRGQCCGRVDGARRGKRGSHLRQRGEVVSRAARVASRRRRNGYPLGTSAST